MARREMPRLGDSPRLYVENTRRTRVHSPGLEHYRSRRRRSAAPWLLVALAALLAALGWFYWMTLG